MTFNSDGETDQGSGGYRGNEVDSFLYQLHTDDVMKDYCDSVLGRPGFPCCAAHLFLVGIVGGLIVGFLSGIAFMGYQIGKGFP